MKLALRTGHGIGSPLPSGGSPNGERQTSPETYLSRTDAQRALWAMTVDRRAEYVLVDRLGLLRQLGMAPTPGQPPT